MKRGVRVWKWRYKERGKEEALVSVWQAAA